MCFAHSFFLFICVPLDLPNKILLSLVFFFRLVCMLIHSIFIHLISFFFYFLLFYTRKVFRYWGNNHLMDNNIDKNYYWCCCRRLRRFCCRSNCRRGTHSKIYKIRFVIEFFWDNFNNCPTVSIITHMHTTALNDWEDWSV